MYNIVEHISHSKSPLQITSTLYDINGSSKSSFEFSLSPGQQYDLLVHDMSGRVENSYGRVCLNHSGIKGGLDGRMVYYKPSDDGFSFAFSMPFEPGIRGVQFVQYNTYQPSLNWEDQDNFVANWVQLTNLENTAQSGTVKLYSLGGEEIGRDSLTLFPGARRDISAHRYGRNNVGVVAWEPADSSARFQMRNVRYYYDNASLAPSFTSAFQLEGRKGSSGVVAVPLNTTNASSIIEITNVLNSEINTEVSIFSAEGILAHTRILSLQPKESVHIIADGILDNQTGIALITSSEKESVLATTMQYGRNTDGSINFLYGISARTSAGKKLQGSYNTFLNQDCRLLIVNPTSQDTYVELDMTRLDGTRVVIDDIVKVPAKSLADYSLCSKDEANTYGTVSLWPETTGSVSATIVRHGSEDQYRFPTPVR
jgi:hypothetical protein